MRTSLKKIGLSLTIPLIVISLAATDEMQARRISEPTIYALLMDGTLVRMNGKRIDRRRLGSVAKGAGVGHYLTMIGRGQTLLALVTGEKRQFVRALSARTLRQRWSIALPAGYRFGSIDVGRSSEIYVGGNDARDGKPVAALIKPPGQLAILPLETPVARDWRIYRLLVTRDERSMIASFHGVDTTGAAVYSRTGSLMPCAASTREGVACIGPVHGDIERYGGQFVATTGTPPMIIEVQIDGSVTRKWDTRLGNNHLVEFALDLPRDTVYAVGSCGYTGGLSAINLTRGYVRVLVHPSSGGFITESSRASGVCGERLAVTGNTLVIGQNARPVPSAHGKAAILLIDTRSRKKTARVPVSSDILDVLAAKP